MRMLLGASGAGKSVVLKLILGLMRPDSGTILVDGQRVDTMAERDLLRLRADMGMVVPGERALRLADGGGERRLPALRGVGPADRSGPRARRGSAGVHRPRRLHRSHAGDAVGRPAPARRHCPGDGVEAEPAAVRRSDDRARSDHRVDRGRRDREAARSGARDVDRRDASDPRCVLYRHPPGGAHGRTDCRSPTSRRPSRRAPSSWCCTRGRIHFQGSAAELLAADDPYLKEFLYRTLPPW